MIVETQKDIKLYRFDIPLRDVFQIATMSLSQANNVLVQIITNEGIVGWGEAASFQGFVYTFRTTLASFSRQMPARSSSRSLASCNERWSGRKR